MKTFVRTCGNLSVKAACADSGRHLGNKVSVDVYKEDDKRYLRLEGTVKRQDILLTESQRSEMFDLEDEKEAIYAFDLFNVKTIFNS